MTETEMTKAQELPPTDVLLPILDSNDSDLWKRALDAAAEGITISDPSLPDNPIIYANRGFERMTGYLAEEVIGRNCRFLQGGDTAPEVVAKIRRAVTAGEDCTVELRNYRKDGDLFWNRLSIRPLRDTAGEVSHFIGIQTDVTRRRTAEEELRRAKQESELAYVGLRESLDVAASIQKSLLPTKPPAVEGLDVGWIFQPCEQLAGDSLNIVRLDERHVAFYMLDVSGHGLPAALLSVTLSRLLSTASEESILFEGGESGTAGPAAAEPSRVLERLNRQFPFEPGTRQYFTIFYGILDMETLQLRYSSAGHPAGVIVSHSGEARILHASGFPVGLVPEARYRDRSVTLRRGDRLVLYTDGVTEATNGSAEEFGSGRLLALLEATRSESLMGGLETVQRTVEEWAGGPGLEDDLSMLSLDIGGVR